MRLSPVTQKTYSFNARHNRTIKKNKMKTFKEPGAQPSATQIQSRTHHGGETTAPSVTLCLQAAWQPAPAICLWSKWLGCCAFLLWCGATVLGFSLTLAVILLCKHVCPLPQLTLLLLLPLSSFWQTWHFGTEAQTSVHVGYKLVFGSSNSLSWNSCLFFRNCWMCLKLAWLHATFTTFIFHAIASCFRHNRSEADVTL